MLFWLDIMARGMDAKAMLCTFVSGAIPCGPDGGDCLRIVFTFDSPTEGAGAFSQWCVQSGVSKNGGCGIALGPYANEAKILDIFLRGSNGSESHFTSVSEGVREANRAR